MTVSFFFLLHRNKKPQYLDNVEDLNRMRLSRFKLEKYVLQNNISCNTQQFCLNYVFFVAETD
jgi:hypothetical protein